MGSYFKGFKASLGLWAMGPGEARDAGFGAYVEVSAAAGLYFGQLSEVRVRWFRVPGCGWVYCN